jgi:hypothetical protein
MNAFHCRDCGRSEARPSRKRNILERLVLPILLLHPVRCGHCFRRQYVPIFRDISNHAHHPDPPQPPRHMAA